MTYVSKSRLWKLLITVAIVIVLFSSWQLSTYADDTAFLSSRISRLESENNALRSRLSHLESQVSRVSADIGLDYTDSSQGEILAPEAPRSSDPMFDRLATLAIELKERIVALEEQVADLQTRMPLS